MVLLRRREGDLPGEEAVAREDFEERRGEAAPRENSVEDSVVRSEEP